MENNRIKKLLKTTCMSAFLGTAFTAVGNGSDLLDIPVNKIHKGPGVKNVERVTYQDKEFTVSVDGKKDTVKFYDVDKSIRDISIEQLDWFLKSGNSLRINQLQADGQNEIDYRIEAEGGLIGGTLVKVPDGGYTKGAGRILQNPEINQIVIKELKKKRVKNQSQYLANHMKAANLADKKYYVLGKLRINIGDYCSQ